MSGKEEIFQNQQLPQPQEEDEEQEEDIDEEHEESALEVEEKEKNLKTTDTIDVGNSKSEIFTSSHSRFTKNNKDSNTPITTCIICNAESNYTCPNCFRKYCSVNCYKSHKDRYSCSGRVEPTKFVKISNFSQVNLNRDLQFLQSIKNSMSTTQAVKSLTQIPDPFIQQEDYNNHRYPNNNYNRRNDYNQRDQADDDQSGTISWFEQKSQFVPHHWKKIQANLFSEKKIILEILPQKWKKREENTSWLDMRSKKMLWKVKFCFHSAIGGNTLKSKENLEKTISVSLDDVPESLKLSQILEERIFRIGKLSKPEELKKISFEEKDEKLQKDKKIKKLTEIFAETAKPIKTMINPHELETKLSKFMFAHQEQAKDSQKGYKIFMKVEHFPKKVYFDILPNKTLQENLTQRVVIEYPVFHVVLNSNLQNLQEETRNENSKTYPLITEDEYSLHIQEMNKILEEKKERKRIWMEKKNKERERQQNYNNNSRYNNNYYYQEEYEEEELPSTLFLQRLQNARKELTGDEKPKTMSEKEEKIQKEDENSKKRKREEEENSSVSDEKETKKPKIELQKKL